MKRHRRRRSGVALLVAIVTITILTVLITEIAYTARVRMLTSAHHRDRVQAHWLAKSGVNLYVLILSANKEIGKNSVIQQLGLGDSLWQMIPTINTGLLRMLMQAEPGGDLTDEDKEEFQKTGKVSDKVSEASRESVVFKSKNFLDFHGDFSAEIKDNESKIDVNQLASETGTLQEGPTAQRLFALMGGEENDQWFFDRNLDRWEMIGNLKDWVDNDNMRSSGIGGYEDSLYEDEEPPYLSKNAKLYSQDEIRLISGWSGELYEKFKDQITIWSNGKFNLNSFDDTMHKAMIRGAALSQPTDSQLDACMNAGGEGVLSMWDVTTFDTSTQYADFILSNCGIELDKTKLSNITKTSKVFTITSTGLVGTSSVTITAVADFTSKSTGKIRYWRIE